MKPNVDDYILLHYDPNKDTSRKYNKEDYTIVSIVGPHDGFDKLTHRIIKGGWNHTENSIFTLDLNRVEYSLLGVFKSSKALEQKYPEYFL